MLTSCAVMTKRAVLKVTIDEKSGQISVWNNGKGIPVQKHETAGVYVPQFIFGAMRAGENFDDSEARTVGGRNGLGAKLTNIFSSEFTVETQDKKHGLNYKQTWTNNMDKVGEPTITKSKDDDYTCISFTPDWKRFSMYCSAVLFLLYLYERSDSLFCLCGVEMRGLDHDMICLLKRRVYDLAGTSNRKGQMAGAPLKVYLNNKRIQIDSFKDYVACFIDKAVAEPSHFVTKDGKYENNSSCFLCASRLVGHRSSHLLRCRGCLRCRWDICATASDGDAFAQMSFVNGIDTGEGGSHVDLVVDQIVQAVIAACQKKQKR